MLILSCPYDQLVDHWSFLPLLTNNRKEFDFKQKIFLGTDFFLPFYFNRQVVKFKY